MRKVLYIFGLLTDADVEWLARNGTRRAFAPGDLLVEEGVATDSLIVVLEGELAIIVKGAGEVTRLGSGEIVGEMSFVDSSPPSATVKASGAGRALYISKAVLREKLRSDVAFSSRFYHALAVFLADRLRGTVHRLGYGETKSLSGDEVMADELDIDLLDSLALAGDRYNRMLKLLGAGR